MRIDIASIDQTRFRVREYNDGKHTLITRAPGLNYDYRPGEHELRSIVVETATGKVVSSGFPKFFNYGEDKATDKAFRKAKCIWYAPKYDGSLIIVSPQEEGPAIVRTRGTYTVDGTPFECVKDMVRDWMLGKQLENDRFGKTSFLFEYVGPENRIVLSYEKSELVYLGWIDHETFEFTPWLQSKPCQDLDALVSEIRGASLDEAGEGVVAYCEDENGKLWICKVKTEEYLALHRLRFDMTPKKLRALTAYKMFNDVQEARDYIEQEVGLDFECVDADVIDRTLERLIGATTDTWWEFEAYCDKYSVRSRKDIALTAKDFTDDKSLQSYLMMEEFCRAGHEKTNEKAHKALVAYAAQMSYRQVEALIEDLP